MATLIGTSADESLTGVWDELNVILGNGGKDTLTGGALSDSIDGGNAKDTIFGGVGDDLLIGGFDGDSISGGSGDDEIRDGDGSDTIDAGSGNDLIDCAVGAKDEVNSIVGGSGDDLILAGKSNDLINGGVGDDLVSYAASAKSVTVNLWNGTGANGDAKNDTYVLVEHAIGSALNDTFIGGVANNIFDGGAGGDNLKGRGGDDVLIGGSGNDVLEGGVGADQIDGGFGVDTLSYEKSKQSVFIDLASDDFSNGDATGDAIASVEIIRAPDLGGSNIHGDAEDNHFVGGPGSETLDGRDGDDVLEGTGSNDNIFGGAGDDTMSGGSDPTTGDTFFWDTPDNGSGAFDVVTDFGDVYDRIYVQNITGAAFADWVLAEIDWDGDSSNDDLQITTDFGVDIILLNFDSANFTADDCIFSNV